MNHVLVIACPERGKCRPGALLVLLPSDPGVLIISLERQPVVELRHNKATMIVGGGIDQVSDDFLDGPLLRRGTDANLGIGKRAEARVGISDASRPAVEQSFHATSSLRIGVDEK